MTGVFDPDWVDPRQGITPAQRPATYGEVWSANRVLARGDRMDAEAERLRREYEPLLTAVNADRARRGLKPMVNPGYWQGPVDRRASSDTGPFDFSSILDKRVSRDEQQALIFGEIAAIRARDPKFLQGVAADLPSFRKGMIDREKAARAGARDVIGRSSGVGQTLAGFAGGVWETMHDPVNIASLPLGGGGKTIWTQAGRSALLNGGLELMQQPFVAANREQLGEELSLGEAGLNTLMGAVGGVVGDVVIPQGAKALARGVGAAIDAATPIDRKVAAAIARADLDGVSDSELASVFGRHVSPDLRTPDERAAIHVLERDAEISASNPYEPTPEGMDAHAAQMQASMEAIIRANTADAPVRIPPVVPGGLTTSPRPRLKTSGGRLASDIIGFFREKGYSEAQARGIAAGIAAESASNHGATNPTSGALGLGQWLGPRKAALVRRYGPNPSRRQQLEFLHHELQGGDHGGAAVLRQTDERAVLDAYIRKFMRPAAGAETNSDLRRGMAALGREMDEAAPAIDVEGAAPALRDPAMDAERVAIGAPERMDAGQLELDYADLPQLRRDLFGSDAEQRLAQADLDGAESSRNILAELQAAPPVEAMRPARNFAEARTAVASFQGQQLRNVETSLSAVVSRNTLDKMLSGKAVAKSTSARDHVQAVANLDEIFPRARLVETGPDARGEPSLSAIHRYHAPMMTADGPVDVRMTVKETRDTAQSNPLYTVETIAVEPASVSFQSGTSAPAPAGGRNVAPAGSETDIAIAATGGNPLAEARQLDLFAEPHGEGAAMQADSLAHDLRGQIEAEADAGATFRLEDGSEASIADILADLDEDTAMIETIKGCL